MDEKEDKDCINEEGEDMLATLPKQKTSKINDLKQRAEYRKKRTELRHQATENEVKIYNDYFKDLEEETYKTIK